MPHDLQSITRWATGLAWTYVGVTAAYLLSLLLLFDQTYAVDTGAVYVDASSGIDYQIVAYLPFVILAILIANYVVNAVWIYRASANARAIDPDEARIRPGWAIGWFAIPIANLWMPFRAIKQCWNSSLLGPGNLMTPAPGMFALWWAAWIISDILGNVSFRMWNNGGTDGIRSSMYVDMASAPLTILAGILWIQIMRRTAEAQANREGLVSVFE